MALLGVVLFPTVSYGASSATVRSELATLEKQLQKSIATYDSTRDKLHHVKAEINQNEAVLAETTVQLGNTQTYMNGRLNKIYRYGADTYLEVLFATSSIQDLIETHDMLTRIADEDRRAIEELKILKKRYEETAAALERERAQRQGELNRDYANRKALEGQMLKKKELLAQLQKAEAESAKRRSSGGFFVSGTVKVVNGLVCPVPGGSFRNDWGAPRRGHSHQGNDIFAPFGTPNLAVTSGTASQRSGGSAGLWVSLHGDDGNLYYYMHLQRFGAGGRVSRGQVIGYGGNTGNASGGSPHTHFEIHPGGGGPVNPYYTLVQTCR